MRTITLPIFCLAFVFSILPLIASGASSHVDTNGNATADSGAAGAPVDEEAELAKQLQNPVASLISVPFQSNWDFGSGPEGDGFKYTMNFQPVVPISLGKDYNLIIRTIVPFIYQDDVVIQDTSQTGLGDTTQSFFISPKKTIGGFVLALGPAMLWPTGTDDFLGSGKWGAGPTGLVLKQQSGWTYGILANQIWSYAGNKHRDYVSSMFLQPFITYTTKTKTTFGVNTESTYDWHNDNWTVPVNLFISQLVKIGKMPVSFTVGGRIYAESPSGGPDWGLRFVVTPLFPTAKKPAESHASTSAK